MSNQLVYKKVADKLRSQILSGQLPYGFRLPAQRELALQLGVSRVTVGRALRELEEEGLIAARRGSGTYVQYRPGQSRHALPSGRTIGLVLPNLRLSVYRRPAEWIIRLAAEHDLAVLVAVYQDDKELFISSIDRLVRAGAAGIIMVPPRETTEKEHKYLRELPVPYIFVIRDSPEVMCDKVVLDNAQIGLTSTRLLLDIGREELLFVAPLDYLTAWDRLRGFRSAIVASDLPYRPERVLDVSAPEDQVREKAANTVAEVVRSGTKVNGIVAFNDYLGASIVGQLVKCGLQVPDDVAVVGVDDDVQAISSPVPLTTVTFDAEYAASRALECLDKRLHNDQSPLRNITLPSHVIWRESCPQPTGGK